VLNRKLEQCRFVGLDYLVAINVFDQIIQLYKYIYIYIYILRIYHGSNFFLNEYEKSLALMWMIGLNSSLDELIFLEQRSFV